MSIKDFTAAIQSAAYRTWLSKLQDNILTQSAKELRKKEQTAAKTSFYVTQTQIRQIYERITGKEIDIGTLGEIFNALQEENEKITNPVKRRESAGQVINVGTGEQAIFFESIGFDTISTKFQEVFEDDNVKAAYANATLREYETRKAELEAQYGKDKVTQSQLDEIKKEADRHGTFGYYVNKGHVISVATNLLKKTRDDIDKAEGLSANQKEALKIALKAYIAKLEADDILTSNLKQIDQTIYANYVKDSYGKYLVEFQFGVENQLSGSVSANILQEIKDLFTLKTEDAEAVIKNSPTLGQALLETEGSPSFIQMLADNLTDIIQTGKSKKKTYTGQTAEVARKSTKVVKSNNKAKISKLKKVLSDIEQTPNKPTVIQAAPMQAATDLTSLLALFNSKLREAIVKNMGTGTSTSVLNYRTGRFASSAKIERLTESREGMITAFYSYMRNPYGTFSTGGRQEIPKSRDPKLLIAKSIRDIAVENIKNRLRAVNV